MERETVKTSAIRLLAVLTLIVGSLVASGSHGQVDSNPQKRAEFMRLKLDYSKKVLEGLVSEDFASIIEGGRKLNLLSKAAEWQVPTIPNAEEYLHYTTDFQRIVDDLIKNARAKNLDGATLAYTRLTINCVGCHKYVRAVTK